MAQHLRPAKGVLFGVEPTMGKNHEVMPLIVAQQILNRFAQPLSDAACINAPIGQFTLIAHDDAVLPGLADRPPPTTLLFITAP